VIQRPGAQDVLPGEARAGTARPPVARNGASAPQIRLSIVMHVLVAVTASAAGQTRAGVDRGSIPSRTRGTRRDRPLARRAKHSQSS